MSEIYGLEAGVQFGMDDELPDWRNEPIADEDEFDPDDEELDDTPEDVIAVLGFDPKELDEIEITESEVSSARVRLARRLLGQEYP